MKSTIGGVTTYFVGNYYEQTGSVHTRYHYAGGQRIAMRTNASGVWATTYILGDHLGSTSITTNNAGAKVSETKYKPWGQVRFQWGVTPTDYTYTGQYSNTADFGLLFYNARWYDPVIGRFAQADTIVPAGVQGYDRYAYVNNNPLRYTDPSGHMAWKGDGGGCDLALECGGANTIQQALDLANEKQKNANHGTVLTWNGLTNDERILFIKAGWTESVYTDHLLGGVSQADMLHDPLTYIMMAVGVGGLIKAGSTATIIVGAQLGTQNPNGVNTVIGGFPEYKNFAQANGYTYFDLGRWYNVLEKFGLAGQINSQFTFNQIDQAKNFLQISQGGAGTANEVSQILNSGLYTQAGAGWSTFTSIFTYIGSSLP